MLCCVVLRCVVLCDYVAWRKEEIQLPAPHLHLLSPHLNTWWVVEAVQLSGKAGDCKVSQCFLFLVWVCVSVPRERWCPQARVFPPMTHLITVAIPVNVRLICPTLKPCYTEWTQTSLWLPMLLWRPTVCPWMNSILVFNWNLELCTAINGNSA